jgi:hypothetical protein
MLYTLFHYVIGWKLNFTLVKLSYRQTSLAQLANWRFSKTGKTGVLIKLANWHGALGKLAL